MRVIIAGGRDIQNRRALKRAIKNSGFDIECIVCGEARGIDTKGRKWAEKRGVPVHSFPAEWDTYGRSAGFRRNEEMAIYAEALILIWDGYSKGSAHMLSQARKRGLKIYEEICV